MAVDAGVGFVDILPRTDQFVTRLTTQIRSTLGKVSANTTSQMSALTKGVQAGFVGLGVVAVAAITKGIEATLEWANQVRALQRITGQSAESASAFAAISNTLGIGVDKLSVGFALLSKNVVTNNKAITDYGISTRDAQGNVLPFDDVLGEVIDKFTALPEGLQRTAFAQRVFGRSGRLLIPILARGREGLAALREEAQKTGLILSQEDLDATKALSIAQRELGESIHGAAVTLGKEFIPLATTVVKVFTTIVQAVDKIPGPVLAGVAAFTALTGAIAAVNLIAGFFISTWTKVLTQIGLTGPVATQAATQLELFGAATETAAGEAGAGGLIASLGGIAPVAAVAAGAIGALGAVFIAWRSDLRATHEEFERGVAQDLDALRSRGRAADAVRQLAARPIPVNRFTARGEVNAAVEQQHAIEAARTALDRYNQTAALTASTQEELAKGIAGLITPLDNLQTPISEVTGLTDDLGISVAKLAPGMDHLTQVSDQDFTAIGEDIQKALADPQTTVDQLPGIFQAALQKTKAQMASWRDSIVQTFGDASAAFQDFFGQASGRGPNRVSFENLTAALDRQRGALERWRSDFKTILRDGGNAAKRFLQDMSQQGLESIGILDTVAAQPKKVRDAFLREYNQVHKATTDIADTITKAFGDAADRIIRKLQELILAVQGKSIHPNVDNRQAIAAMDELISRERLAFQLGSQIGAGKQGPVAPGPVSPRQAAQGVIMKGASGFIATRPMLIGEGRGDEAVIPLNERGANFAKRALGGGGDDQVLRELRALRAVLERGHGHELSMDGYRVGRALGVRQDRKARL